jgi:[FeFe] hydrogenase H-cluster maturation GTPase HydF
MKGRDLQPHVGIFGRRNVGKSSLINALTGHDVAIVSAMPGTTTDPVRKSMELFGIGPVVLIDTAGIDDRGTLGEKRTARTEEVIRHIDCALLVIADNVFGVQEEKLIHRFSQLQVSCVIVHNKTDEEPLSKATLQEIRQCTDAPVVSFSALTLANLEGLVEMLKQAIPETAWKNPSLLKGIIGPGDIVMLITPIDSEAPEGRMILPQVRTIRDVLDNDAVNIVLKETEVASFLRNTGIRPALVLTDSQAFATVNKIIPADIPLSGFSVAFARMRGPFPAYVEGTRKIDELKDGDRILILESCTHQISCEDIGRSKIPNWLSKYTGRKLEFEVVAGMDPIPRPIAEFALVIQCGACMITGKQVFGRLHDALEAGVPVTNYGLTIAWMNGIFDRAVAPFL